MCYDEHFNSLFSSICNRLELFTYESFANLRISELFDIIIDFPDSIPALHDLRDCLIKTNQLSHLIRSLNQAYVPHNTLLSTHTMFSFKKRLLHPGANTADIIVQFINTIKVLQVLDPTILSMDLLSQPIRDYLQTREDTIRCAVKMFTNENSEMYQELTQITSDSGKQNTNSDTWEPLPAHSIVICLNQFLSIVNVLTYLHTASSVVTPQDTFSHLVNIFGSKDLFVAEYRNMLAERLLDLTDFRAEREVLFNNCYVSLCC